MEEKLNLAQMHKTLYNPSNKGIHIVKVPAFSFIMLDGTGDPNNSPEYQTALTTLYCLAYSIKFAKKKKTGVDFKVMPLEGLWWVKNYNELDFNDKRNWQWTMMIHQPSLVTWEDLCTAQKECNQKNNHELAFSARLEQYTEGLAAQILYIGAYANEQPTIQAMHSFIKEQGYQLHKKHHEIYLNDPRRTAPEKLKTIIRQPVCSPA